MAQIIDYNEKIRSILNGKLTPDKKNKFYKHIMSNYFGDEQTLMNVVLVCADGAVNSNNDFYGMLKHLYILAFHMGFIFSEYERDNLIIPSGSKIEIKS